MNIVGNQQKHAIFSISFLIKLFHVMHSTFRITFRTKNMLSVIVFRRLHSSSNFISFKIITFIVKRLYVFVNYFFCESRSGHQVAKSVGWDGLHKSISSGTDRRHSPLLAVCFCIWMHPQAPSFAEGRVTNISNPENIVRAHECWQSRHVCNYSVIPPQMWFLLGALRPVTPTLLSSK